MDIKCYYIWNSNREYQGVKNHVTRPDCKYYLEVIPPECPPEYPDGWYLVTFDGDAPVILVREKKRDWAHDERGGTTRLWNLYKVIASLEGVKFLDGRDE